MDFQVINDIQLNLFTAALLEVFFAALLAKKEFISFSGKMIRNLTILTFVLLLLEALSYVVNGIDSEIAFIMNYLLNLLLFIFTPMLASIGVSYLDFKIFKSTKRVRKRLYYMHPFLIVLPLSIINIFYPLLFSIETGNIYERRPFILINILVLYATLSYALHIVYKHRKNIDKNIIYGLGALMIIPAIGGGIQMLFFGISTLYASVGVATIATYIVIETVGTTRDYLTKVFNKTKAYEYIEFLIDKNIPFSVIMIDLEDFKQLNDEHGHLQGDIALMQFAFTLQAIFDEDALISRFGGDEFLIIFEETKIPVIESKKALVNHLVAHSNDKIVQNVKFSYGYSICTDFKNTTAEQLIVSADNNMFKDKAKNKNYMRRKTD